MKEVTASGTVSSVAVVPDSTVRYVPVEREGTSYRVSAEEKPAERSVEYDRFERLMKRLVQVPKKDIDARRERKG